MTNTLGTSNPYQAATVDPNSGRRLIINELMIDSETGITGRGYSPDNGQTRVVQNTIKGRIYNEDDQKKIYQLMKDIPHDYVKLRSPNGAVFLVSVDNDGNLKATKEGEANGTT